MGLAGMWVWVCPRCGKNIPSTVPFHHRWLVPAGAASPCISSIPGRWCLCRAPALLQAWLWMWGGVG